MGSLIRIHTFSTTMSLDSPERDLYTHIKKIKFKQGKLIILSNVSNLGKYTVTLPSLLGTIFKVGLIELIQEYLTIFFVKWPVGERLGIGFERMVTGEEIYLQSVSFSFRNVILHSGFDMFFNYPFDKWCWLLIEENRSSPRSS